MEEYQRFVGAGGYEEEDFWEASGWALREEQGWERPGGWEEQLHLPNRPVIRVSWYEAAAYCRWLGRQRSDVIRLPMQAEWEKAATPDGEEYPWGRRKPSPELANFDQDLGGPTPVGIYPAGDGPFGHSDLAGNVWEWCGDIVEVENCDRWRVTRGGSWFDPPKYLRATLRTTIPARERNVSFIDLGFRVAVAPASP